MTDYSDFPPIKYFTRVLKNCPKSALLYTQIWKKKDKYDTLTTRKIDVRKDYLISPTLFRNLLAPLMLLNLVSLAEGEENFKIDVLGLQVND